VPLQAGLLPLDSDCMGESASVIMRQKVRDFSAWGRYPRVHGELVYGVSPEGLASLLKSGDPFIPLGNRRSYGDSALAARMLDVRPCNYMLDFDPDNGLLHAQAGVLLSDILETFVPRGWFLPVTPGTKYITVGGAIASDVHGKNHHLDGCFSRWVKEISIMLPGGQVVSCSRSKKPELFLATCGGQGLTGVILEAKFYLKKIDSCLLEQVTVRTNNLMETFDAFEQYRNMPYSVAWIDGTAKGPKTGRGIFTSASFMKGGDFDYRPHGSMDIPVDFPTFFMNKALLSGFNFLYYHRTQEWVSYQQVVDIDTFFYPLDRIGQWNRLYGRRGFVQYHFILPKRQSLDGILEIMREIDRSGISPYLAVLKLYGMENRNLLSFPLEGYGLALDFKIQKGLFDLLDRLDNIVAARGGRLYLTKDSRMNRKMVEKGYPGVWQFRRFRRSHDMDKMFQSLQSRRLGL